MKEVSEMAEYKSQCDNERERVCVRRGKAERERETQNLKQDPGSELSARAQCGAQTHRRTIRSMT